MISVKKIISNALLLIAISGIAGFESTVYFNSLTSRFSSGKIYIPSQPQMELSDCVVIEGREDYPTVLYIPKGYTLTIRGTDANKTYGALPAILLPSYRCLVITGEGNLNIYGGNAGNGGAGSNGYSYAWGSCQYLRTYGGKGGDGGGGGAPAIGGKGGDGGTGGTCNEAYGDYDWGGWWGANGNNGTEGKNGSRGEDMGTLYVLGSLHITGSAGLGGNPGAGGGSASGDHSSGKMYEAYTGGSGGGGGGGSGMGLNSHFLESRHTFLFGGGGGGGAGGGAGGGGGLVIRYYTTSTRPNGTRGLGGAPDGNDGNGETSTDYLDDHGDSNRYGGTGGEGGLMGSRGGNGTYYQGEKVTISALNDTQVRPTGGTSFTETHTCIQYTITFLDNENKQEAEATATFGCQLPTCPYIPTSPNKVFIGWKLNDEESLNIYYGSDGTPMHSCYSDTKDITLIPVWETGEDTDVYINDQRISTATQDSTYGEGWVFDGTTVYLNGTVPYKIHGNNADKPIILSFTQSSQATISNLTLKCSGTKQEGIIKVAPDTTLNLKLAGVSEIISDNSGAAIYVPEFATLTITNAPSASSAKPSLTEPDQSTRSVLIAEGDLNSAAIGGCKDEYSGNIKIYSGTIQATGGSNCISAIGSGKSKNVETVKASIIGDNRIYGGSITINSSIIPAPRNAYDRILHCALLRLCDNISEKLVPYTPVSFELPDYNTKGIYANYDISLWIPTGNYLSTTANYYHSISNQSTSAITYEERTKSFDILVDAEHTEIK